MKYGRIMTERIFRSAAFLLLSEEVVFNVRSNEQFLVSLKEELKRVNGRLCSKSL